MLIVRSVGGITISIAAFQAVDPGLTNRITNLSCITGQFRILTIVRCITSTVQYGHVLVVRVSQVRVLGPRKILRAEGTMPMYVKYNETLSPPTDVV
ncbi:hypothetical protein TNCV_3413361 [Trichonephila clavipes]|uniref:Uncharacterized protein n=1 Tax=Trichonephila clavipes TaxID=2585209 RepID=A0A8X6V5K5_TRICX|nr:hypothetical protein TNCV_3413361 [Trichonephila clavipes]